MMYRYIAKIRISSGGSGDDNVVNDDMRYWVKMSDIMWQLMWYRWWDTVVRDRSSSNSKNNNNSDNNI